MLCQKFQQLTAAPTLKKGDSAAAVQAKVVVAPLLISVAAFLVFVFLALVADKGEFTIRAVALPVSAAFSLTLYGLLVAGFDVGKLIPPALLAYAVTILAVDYGDIMERPVRVWHIVVCVVDVALVLSASTRLTISVVIIVVVYLFFVALDISIFGLYERIRSMSVWTDKPETAFCACADPPCMVSVDEALGPALVALFVFLLDFYLTRGFSTAMQHQLKLVGTAVEVAEKIAVHLSRYETAEAQAVADDPCLPAKLRGAFMDLVSNLEQYRPYLPKSVLAGATDDESECATQPRRTDTVATVSDLRRMSSADTISTGTGTDAGGAAVRMKLRHDARQRRVTLLCLNRTGFTAYASTLAPDQLSELVATLISALEEAAGTCKGVIDLVSCDHLYVSFNGARPNASHSLSAVRCACSQKDALSKGGEAAEGRLSLTAACVAGTAMTGDFGTKNTLRNMTVHRMCSLLLCIERAAAKWKVPLLITQPVNEAVSCAWQCRLCTCAQFPAKYGDEMLYLWEVLQERECFEENVEWMYSMPADPYKEINDAMTAWARGRRQMAEEIATEVAERGRPSLRNAAAALLSRMESADGGAVVVLVEGVSSNGD